MLFPDFTSCCWLSENASWPIFGSFTDVFSSPKTKITRVTALRKFEKTLAFKCQGGFPQWRGGGGGGGYYRFDFICAFVEIVKSSRETSQFRDEHRGPFQNKTY